MRLYDTYFSFNTVFRRFLGHIDFEMNLSEIKKSLKIREIVKSVRAKNGINSSFENGSPENVPSGSLCSKQAI